MNAIETFQQAVDFLYQFINYERMTTVKYNSKNYDLDSYRKLLNKLDNPHLSSPSVHIAGTKGKGSTAAFLASILNCAGIRTGLYTSPHLVDIRERIRIDNRLIPIPDFKALVSKLKTLLDDPDVKLGGGYRTTFELLTTLAFLFFRNEKVDCAIFETGMGGRLDCTNVIDPMLTIITPVSFDHIESLGFDLESIAWEKAGIMKPGVSTLISSQPPEVMNVFENQSRQVGAMLNPVDQILRVSNLRLSHEGSFFSLHHIPEKKRELFIPIPGRHFADNAILAVEAALTVGRKLDRKISDDHIRKGLKTVRWPGRMTVINSRFPDHASKNVRYIVDGAHNPAAIERLVETIKIIDQDRPVYVIFASPINKQIELMIVPLASIARQFIVTKYQNPRAKSVDELKVIADRHHSSVRSAANLYTAMNLTLQIPLEKFDVLICGSLYLAGEALRLLGMDGVT